MPASPVPSPAHAFAHKTVLLTGGTGFLGKAMIEKLLRSVPSIEKIYVLIRPREQDSKSRMKAALRKDLSAAQRLDQEIIHSPIFTRLRHEYGSSHVADAFLRSKLCAVAGDITLPRLGLSSENLYLLQHSVHIVIHAATAGELDAPLDESFRVNCGGAMQVLDFVHSCSLLQCHMHISTAFVNSNFAERGETTVYEELYPLAFDVEEAFLALSKAASPQEVAELHDQLIGSYPNTYSLTKSMAEHLVTMCMRLTLPVVIFRPTIIGASMAEPEPGWIDQTAGAGALLLSIISGSLQIFPGRPENIVDIVPVDLAVNTALASIAAVVSGHKKMEPHRAFIVHSGTSDVNPFQWEMATRPVSPCLHQGKQSSRPSKFRMIKTHAQFQTEWFLKYTLPVSVSSGLAKLRRSEDRTSKVNERKKRADRTRQLITAFQPYASDQWIFQTTGSRRVLDVYVIGSDGEWWLDATTIDWQSYVASFYVGLQKNGLHEEAERDAVSSV